MLSGGVGSGELSSFGRQANIEWWTLQPAAITMRRGEKLSMDEDPDPASERTIIFGGARDCGEQDA